MSEQTDSFEERAGQFRKDTGFMAPGKDLPGEEYDGYTVRLELWKMWHELAQLEAERDELREFYEAHQDILNSVEFLDEDNMEPYHKALSKAQERLRVAAAALSKQEVKEC